MTFETEMAKKTQNYLAECYEVKIGNQTKYYTSFDDNVIFGGNKYLKTVVEREPLTFLADLQAIRTNVKIQLAEPFSASVANTPDKKQQSKFIRYLYMILLFFAKLLKWHLYEHQETKDF